jgi:hypothetical protein
MIKPNSQKKKGSGAQIDQSIVESATIGNVYSITIA